MDSLSTFLELPLDRELYQTKVFVKRHEEPLRILVTEAASKIACKLLYKICSGEVFGPDQGVILHLITPKGSVDLTVTLEELHSCGFSVLMDTVVSSEPEKIYSKVDIVVMIAPIEEISGHPLYMAFLHQMVKLRQVAKNITLYAKPDTKLVLAGPSTKGITVLLSCLSILEPTLKPSNVSAVTALDETVSKALIAAKLKTTTENIKNVVIWGGTYPDVYHSTACIYPPEDKGNLEKTDIPLTEALQDHKWLFNELPQTISQRIMNPALLRRGMAVASATAKHLKILFHGSESHNEITSMATIIPSNRPYGFDENTGFSVPVTIKNGSIKIRENFPFDSRTFLLNLRHMFRLKDKMQFFFSWLNFLQHNETVTTEDLAFYGNKSVDENIAFKTWLLKNIVTPNPHGSRQISTQSKRKSIAWNNVNRSNNINIAPLKSLLRFRDIKLN